MNINIKKSYHKISTLVYNNSPEIRYQEFFFIYRMTTVRGK